MHGQFSSLALIFGIVDFWCHGIQAPKLTPAAQVVPLLRRPCACGWRVVWARRKCCGSAGKTRDSAWLTLHVVPKGKGIIHLTGLDVVVRLLHHSRTPLNSQQPRVSDLPYLIAIMRSHVNWSPLSTAIAGTSLHWWNSPLSQNGATPKLDL